MVQEIEAHGKEGGLALARLECHSTRGGKPAFPTSRLLCLSAFFVSE